MTGITNDILLAVNRVRSTFSDGIGNGATRGGTGFWLQISPERKVFITNRHNVDSSIWNPSCKWPLVKCEVEVRRRGPRGYLDETTFVEFDDPAQVVVHPTADCALFPDALRAPADGEWAITPISAGMLADQSFLATKAQVTDVVSFIGFPGKTQKWWDEAANLPIARLASVASNPGRMFQNSAIETTDVVLVSGLSLSGSSGSPVLLHQKGIQVAPPLSGGSYVPSTLIGIMSGHLQDHEPDKELLQHTGLSYFTRSTSIHELLSKI